jgi:PDZ domain-containing protein
MRSILPVNSKLPLTLRLTLILLVSAAFLINTPYVILAPGQPQNILGSAISISGTKVYPTDGKLSVTSVMVTDPDSYMTGFDVLYNWINPDNAVLPRVDIYPPNESASDAFKLGAIEMQDSQLNATAAALKYLGYDFQAKLIIAKINRQSKAFNLLKLNDELLSVDNVKYESQAELAKQLESKKPGDQVLVKILRGGTTVIENQIELSEREDGSAFIGIGIKNEYEFPFKVNIKLAQTGGPSGGLIFALGVIEKLTQESLVRSRNIAGTGTITNSGKVGPIGGIAEKIIGANRAGVDLFFAPIENCEDLKNIETVLSNSERSRLKIVPVATLAEAVSILRMPSNTQYPSCQSTQLE